MEKENIDGERGGEGGGGLRGLGAGTVEAVWCLARAHASPTHTHTVCHNPPPANQPTNQPNHAGDEFQQIILNSQASQYLKQDAPGVTIPYQ
jgi:hypothetical protein